MMDKLPTSTNLLIGFGHPPPPPASIASVTAAANKILLFKSSRTSPKSGPSAEATVVPALFLIDASVGNRADHNSAQVTESM